MSSRFAAILLGALLLVWPAVLNGYPIVFSDTGGLLDMGLLPTMGWDKPFVYGPLIAGISLRITLWLPLAAQGVLLSYTLLLLQDAISPAPALRHLMLCAILAAFTAAPWFTATLMPDMLTPVAALSLIAAARPLPRTQTIAAMLLAAIAIAAHLSHLILAAGLVAALSILHRRIVWRPLASLIAALLFLLASNWIGHGRLAISPYGSVFALARLIGDGPARDYLDRTCPQAGWALCPWRDRLTSDSDQFLWDAASPFWSDPLPLADFAAQASQIVRGTVLADPLRIARHAYRNAAQQLIRVDLGDTLVADHLAETVRPRIQRWYPAFEQRWFDRGHQLDGTLSSAAERLVPLQRAALLLGLAATAGILMAGLRHNSARADFAALVLIALGANALATGALSTVHDRYQARLAWLVLLPLTLSFKPPARSPANAPALRRPEPASP